MLLPIILAILMFIFMILTIECKYDTGRALFVTITVILACFSIALAYEYDKIDPIEVYRGNTELEITYKNNVPIDTVVVWKNK
jgi:hypothetical protein